MILVKITVVAYDTTSTSPLAMELLLLSYHPRMHLVVTSDEVSNSGYSHSLYRTFRVAQLFMPYLGAPDGCLVFLDKILWGCIARLCSKQKSKAKWYVVSRRWYVTLWGSS
ncbi:hypothetical protein F4859DRAFT_459941 [Xylaria cf. heliscus]|nr:hypothetical protein F4859DRAFT_459941 [Xylaria cf. heliscus]